MQTEIFTPEHISNPESNSALLRHFYQLDNEIHDLYETVDYSLLFHSFEFAIMNATAKQLLRKLNVI